MPTSALVAEPQLRVPVLEDAAQAAGTTQAGRPAGLRVVLPDRPVSSVDAARLQWLQMVATMDAMAIERKRIRLSDPEIAGSYEVVERRPDGSLLLRPERERLSDVLRETDGAVFRDEEFIAHLGRVAETDDDLPGDTTT